MKVQWQVIGAARSDALNRYPRTTMGRYRAAEYWCGRRLKNNHAALSPLQSMSWMRVPVEGSAGR
jgi:hypothetical protein